MQIFVRDAEGTSQLLTASHDDTLSSVLGLLQEKLGDEIDLSDGYLSFGGRVGRTATLADLGVSDNSTLDFSLSLLGGGKKRKKKTFTTAKKTKHKKKKVKLAVLKYYKVDESGKITRLRRECESATCGGGIFLASHFDRLYCGKCARTLNFTKDKAK